MTAWANFVVSGNGCTCCGNVPAPNCFLSLPPPTGDGGYTDFAAANAVINNQTDNCLAFAEVGAGGYINSLAAQQPAGNTAWVNFLGLSDGGLSYVAKAWLASRVSTNTAFDVNYSSVNDGYSTEFYYSNGASLGQVVGASGTMVIPTADDISVRFTAENTLASGAPVALNVNIYSPNAVTYCSIRANYDSGGGAYTWLNC